MSSYFSMPSFARAKKNKEDLEKSNPTEPVLKDEDEEYLKKVATQDGGAPEVKDVFPTKTTDSGEEKQASKGEQASTDQLAVSGTKPESSADKADETVHEPVDDSVAPKQDQQVEDPPEQVPEDSTEAVDATAAKTKKSKKDKRMELPSQEEAEAATRGFDAAAQQPDKSESGEKKTWSAYLASISKGSKKDGTSEEKPATTQHEGQGTKLGDQRTWTQKASDYVPSSLPALPSLPASWSRSRDKDAKSEPVYKEDGTVDEEATKEKQEKEVSVLLDNLNMSSINNRVFSLSEDSQKIYHRFTQVLKDVIEGGPTAYDDMEKLMHDAGPQLEKQFQAMPPFVQTLVKSLPAKLGTTLGPELLAAASEKPGNDMQQRMKAASKRAESGGDPSVQTAETSEKDGEKKKKKKIPGLKGLVSQQGAVVSMLRSTVSFVTTRFPFLASTTNVVMSLSGFILMFAFWYCYKRGHETRLAREAAAAQAGSEKVEEGETVAEEDGDFEATDEEELDEKVDDGTVQQTAQAAEGDAQPESTVDQGDSTEAVSKKAEQVKSEKDHGDALHQLDPTEVPLPGKGERVKGTTAEA